MSIFFRTFAPDFALMSEHTPHIIDLSTLQVGRYQFDYQLDSAYFATIEGTELLGGNVEATAVLDLREEDFSLRIGVRGTVQVTCDRCLDSMDVAVDAEEDIAMEDEGEERTEQVQQVDLDWLAYELIIVNLPIVHSHQPGGCNPQMDALLQNHLCTEVEDEITGEEIVE